MSWFLSFDINPAMPFKVLYSVFPSTLPKCLSWIMYYYTKIGTIQNPIANVLYQMYQNWYYILLLYRTK